MPAPLMMAFSRYSGTRMNSFRIRPVAASEQRLLFNSGRVSARSVRVSIVPPLVLRMVFYAFVFSLPLEKTDVVFGGLPLAKLLGLVLVAVTVGLAVFYEPRLRLELPSKAFWLFLGYIAVYAVLGLDNILAAGEDSQLAAVVNQGIKTLAQLLIVFVIAYNLLQYRRIVKGTLLVLAASCILVAVLQSLNMTPDLNAHGRTAAFDANPNLIGDVLSLGMLALVGLAYGAMSAGVKFRLLFWPGAAVIALAIVTTGSRGTMLALTVALLVFFLTGQSSKTKIKAGLVALLVVTSLAWLSYRIKPIRERWENTYYEGDVSGRENIFSVAWELFREKPLAGWGPNHIYEIGFRLGLEHPRDTHNTYLWLLTETGLLGAVPFMAGLCVCWLSAWRARNTARGVLSAAMMINISLLSMSGTGHLDKTFWLVLAYAAAGSGYASAAAKQPWRTKVAVLGSLRRQPAKDDTGAVGVHRRRNPAAQRV